MLRELISRQRPHTLEYYQDDKSLSKATWLITMYLLSSLLDCVSLLRVARHRPVTRVFHNVVESIDVLRFFHSGSTKAASALRKWYENETISHGEV